MPPQQIRMPGPGHLGPPKARLCYVRRPWCLCTARAHMDCYVSISTTEGIGLPCTANTAARAVLLVAISFTRRTQNGNILSEEIPEDSATITRHDARRHHPLVDVIEGGRHRSIGCRRAPDVGAVFIFVVLFDVAPLHEVPVAMIPRMIATFDMGLLVTNPHTNVLLSSNVSTSTANRSTHPSPPGLLPNPLCHHIQTFAAQATMILNQAPSKGPQRLRPLAPQHPPHHLK